MRKSTPAVKRIIVASARVGISTIGMRKRIARRWKGTSAASCSSACSLLSRCFLMMFTMATMTAVMSMSPHHGMIMGCCSGWCFYIFRSSRAALFVVVLG